MKFIELSFSIRFNSINEKKDISLTSIDSKRLNKTLRKGNIYKISYNNTRVHPRTSVDYDKNFSKLSKTEN